jgi:hypothetical protein
VRLLVLPYYLLAVGTSSVSLSNIEPTAVGQTDASFVRLQVAEVKTTDALKRMDFETSVTSTEASKDDS